MYTWLEYTIYTGSCEKTPLHESHLQASQVLSLLGVPACAGTLHTPPAREGAAPVPPHGRQGHQQEQKHTQGSRGPLHRLARGSVDVVTGKVIHFQL